MTELSQNLRQLDEVGFMSWEEFRRFRWAVGYSLKLVPWLRVAGYVKGEQDEIRSAAVEPPLGLPPTWVAAEDITRLSLEMNGWSDLEDIAADDYGVEIARQFTREVSTAAHKWPFEDRPHKVQWVRCPACGYTSLRYQPPEFGGDVVTVQCQECRHVVSDEEFAALTALIASEFANLKEKRERRLGDGPGSGRTREKGSGDDLPVGEGGPGAGYAAGEGFVA